MCGPSARRPSHCSQTPSPITTAPPILLSGPHACEGDTQKGRQQLQKGGPLMLSLLGRLTQKDHAQLCSLTPAALPGEGTTSSVPTQGPLPLNQPRNEATGHTHQHTCSRAAQAGLALAWAPPRPQVGAQLKAPWLPGSSIPRLWGEEGLGPFSTRHPEPGQETPSEHEQAKHVAAALLSVPEARPRTTGNIGQLPANRPRCPQTHSREKQRETGRPEPWPSMTATLQGAQRVCSPRPSADSLPEPQGGCGWSAVS